MGSALGKRSPSGALSGLSSETFAALYSANLGGKGSSDLEAEGSNYIRSHRNRDVLARGAIPCEAEPGEPDQHHCPGRGLRNRAADGEVETKSA
jgi:hypothetical protein